MQNSTLQQAHEYDSSTNEIVKHLGSLIISQRRKFKRKRLYRCKLGDLAAQWMLNSSGSAMNSDLLTKNYGLVFSKQGYIFHETKIVGNQITQDPKINFEIALNQLFERSDFQSKFINEQDFTHVSIGLSQTGIHNDVIQIGILMTKASFSIDKIFEGVEESTNQTGFLLVGRQLNLDVKPCFAVLNRNQPGIQCTLGPSKVYFQSIDGDEFKIVIPASVLQVTNNSCPLTSTQRPSVQLYGTTASNNQITLANDSQPNNGTVQIGSLPDQYSNFDPDLAQQNDKIQLEFATFFMIPDDVQKLPFSIETALLKSNLIGEMNSQKPTNSGGLRNQGPISGVSQGPPQRFLNRLQEARSGIRSTNQQTSFASRSVPATPQAQNQIGKTKAQLLREQAAQQRIQANTSTHSIQSACFGGTQSRQQDVNQHNMYSNQQQRHGADQISHAANNVTIGGGYASARTSVAPKFSMNQNQRPIWQNQQSQIVVPSANDVSFNNNSINTFQGRNSQFNPSPTTTNLNFRRNPQNITNFNCNQSHFSQQKSPISPTFKFQPQPQPSQQQMPNFTIGNNQFNQDTSMVSQHNGNNQSFVAQQQIPFPQQMNSNAAAPSSSFRPSFQVNQVTSQQFWQPNINNGPHHILNPYHLQNGAPMPTTLNNQFQSPISLQRPSASQTTMPTFQFVMPSQTQQNNQVTTTAMTPSKSQSNVRQPTFTITSKSKEALMTADPGGTIQKAIGTPLPVRFQVNGSQTKLFDSKGGMSSHYCQTNQQVLQDGQANQVLLPQQQHTTTLDQLAFSDQEILKSYLHELAEMCTASELHVAEQLLMQNPIKFYDLYQQACIQKEKACLVQKQSNQAQQLDKAKESILAKFLRKRDDQTNGSQGDISQQSVFKMGDLSDIVLFMLQFQEKQLPSSKYLDKPNDCGQILSKIFQGELTNVQGLELAILSKPLPKNEAFAQAFAQAHRSTPDLKFILRGDKFSGHKFVFEQTSSFLRDVMRENNKANVKQFGKQIQVHIFTLPEWMDPIALKQFIKFNYLSQVDMQGRPNRKERQIEALNLFRAACYFYNQTLCEYLVASEIIPHMNSMSAIMFLNEIINPRGQSPCQRQPDERVQCFLRDYCMFFLAKNLPLILRKDEKELLTLPHQELYDIVKQSVHFIVDQRADIEIILKFAAGVWAEGNFFNFFTQIQTLVERVCGFDEQVIPESFQIREFNPDLVYTLPLYLGFDYEKLKVNESRGRNLNKTMDSAVQNSENQERQESTTDTQNRGDSPVDQAKIGFPSPTQNVLSHSDGQADTQPIENPDFTFEVELDTPEVKQHLEGENKTGVTIFSRAFNSKRRSWTLKIDIKKPENSISLYLVERGAPFGLTDSFEKLRESIPLKFSSVLAEIEVNDPSLKNRKTAFFFSYSHDQSQIVGHQDYVTTDQLSNPLKLKVSVKIREHMIHSAFMTYFAATFSRTFKSQIQKLDEIRSKSQTSMQAQNHPYAQSSSNPTSNYYPSTLRSYGGLQSSANTNYYQQQYKTHHQYQSQQQQTYQQLQLQKEKNEAIQKEAGLLCLPGHTTHQLLASDHLKVEDEHTVLAFVFHYTGLVRERSGVIQAITAANHLTRSLRLNFVDFYNLMSAVRKNQVLKSSIVFTDSIERELKERLKIGNKPSLTSLLVQQQFQQGLCGSEESKTGQEFEKMMADQAMTDIDKLHFCGPMRKHYDECKIQKMGRAKLLLSEEGPQIQIAKEMMNWALTSKIGDLTSNLTPVQRQQLHVQESAQLRSLNLQMAEEKAKTSRLAAQLQEMTESFQRAQEVIRRQQGNSNSQKQQIGSTSGAGGLQIPPRIPIVTNLSDRLRETRAAGGDDIQSNKENALTNQAGSKRQGEQIRIPGGTGMGTKAELGPTLKQNISFNSNLFLENSLASQNVPAADSQKFQPAEMRNEGKVPAFLSRSQEVGPLNAQKQQAKDSSTNDNQSGVVGVQSTNTNNPTRKVPNFASGNSHHLISGNTRLGTNNGIQTKKELPRSQTTLALNNNHNVNNNASMDLSAILSQVNKSPATPAIKNRHQGQSRGRAAFLGKDATTDDNNCTIF